MNSIKQNYNNYGYNPKFSADGDLNQIPQAVQIPDIYYMPDSFEKPAGLKENIKKFDLMNLISPWFEHPLLMLGICAGISLGVDKVERSFGKEYEKSSLGKAAKFGDKIEQSKFIQSEASQSALKGINKGWGSIKNFFMKSDVIKAMFKTPSEPKMKMPKDELKHTEFRIVSKFRELANNMNLIQGGPEGKQGYKKLKLRDICPSKEEKEALKKLYNVKRLSEVKEEGELVNRLILQRLGKSESEIKGIIKSSNANGEVISALKTAAGLTEKEWQTIMADETGESLQLVKKASANLKNVKVNVGKWKIPGEYQPFTNTSGFGEIYNKIHSLTDGAKTKTGKFMSRLLQKLHRGFTFGGTKVGVLFFVAPFLAETVLNTKKADKKEKVGTFVQGAINAVSWVFIFPLVLKIIHAYGGIQYAGMGKEKVEEYKNLIEEFNKKALGKEFKTKSEYKIAKKELKSKLKALRTVKDESLLTKVLRRISHITKADLTAIAPFQNGTGTDFLRKLPSTLRNKWFYSAARFGIFMFAGMPLLDKLVEKCVAKIFGKSYDPYKQAELENAKKEQELFTIKDLKQRMAEIQQNKINSNQQTPELHTTGQTASVFKSNYVNEPNSNEKIPSRNYAQQNVQPQLTHTSFPSENSISKGKNDNYTYIPSQNNIIKEENSPSGDSNNYIPSQDNILKDENTPSDDINKYIPSQKGANITKTFDNSGLESALRKADLAEQKALQILSGNF